MVGRAGAKRKAEPQTEDLSSFSVADLREKCNENNLPSTGTKTTLVKRLQQHASDDVRTPKVRKQSTLEKVAAAVAATGSDTKKTHKVDERCPVKGGKVYKDYDCMLNQTNIGHNNNKYYLIQIIEQGNGYCVWNRWGRVGAIAGTNLSGPYKNLQDAVSEFEKKFRDKTKNAWSNRNNFVSHSGKYTLIDMGEGEPETSNKTVTKTGKNVKVEETEESELDPETANLIKFIFDAETFQNAMFQMGIDQNKMPLGKLSKVQIAKGFQILDQLKKAVNAKKPTSILQELSNQYYTAIPCNVGFGRLQAISTLKEVDKKIEDLCDLSDIELAQALQSGGTEKEKKRRQKKGKKPPHPLDVKYGLLDCDLELIKKTDPIHKQIETNLAASKGPYIKKLKNIWAVNRHSAGTRLKKHDGVKNRRLLWHGTSAAVMAAILKTGIRIMPGRCQGIFHANDNYKSNFYVRSVKKTGIMLLNEVVLGNQYDIPLGQPGWHDPPPKGYDSVVARMNREPDPKKDIIVRMDGKAVQLAQGSPVDMTDAPWYTKNTWSNGQSEWIVYSESQVRIRYLLEFDWVH